MTDDIRFFVEGPEDEFGNTACPRAVIQARVENYTDSSGSHRQRLHVLAPEEYARKWPTQLLDVWTWIEVEDGPARMLSGEEWEQLTGFTRR